MKRLKINEIIWNQSMEVYLPSGEQYIRKAICYSLSSPYTYSGTMNKVQVCELYCLAVDFALSVLF
jgi:hypothetical protein